MRDLLALIHGGRGVPFSKSIRGRLHEVENIQRAADNLNRAARQMRRGNVVVPRSVFTTIGGTVIVMAALSAVIAFILSLAH